MEREFARESRGQQFRQLWTWIGQSGKGSKWKGSWIEQRERSNKRKER
jgi:hypothetical protein